MKNILTILLIGIAATTISCRDKDVITRNVNDLPAMARTILNEQFAQSQISYIKIEKELFEPTTYDVRLVNGMKVSFDDEGNWTEVDGKRSEVPAFFIPEEIRKQVEDMFPGEKITQIEKEPREYEVELTNGVELTFDKDFNLRDVD